MRLVVLREIPEDETLRRQWNALVDRVEQPQVFYTYEWAMAVYRAYHATLHPLLFLAYDEAGALRGLAALATDAAGKEASFLCATTGDYCDVLSSVEDRAAFVDEVFGGIKKLGIAAAALANLPSDSPTVAAMRRAAANHHFHCFARTAYECAQVLLGSLERRGGEKPVLPRKKMLRRFVNAMGREAPVRLEHARSWSDVQPIFPEFARAHVARFLATGRISNLARSERRDFSRRVGQVALRNFRLARTHPHDDRYKGGCVELWIPVSRHVVLVPAHVRQRFGEIFAWFLPASKTDRGGV